VFFSDNVGVKHLHSDHSLVVQITHFIKNNNNKNNRHPPAYSSGLGWAPNLHIFIFASLSSVYCTTICTNKCTIECHQNFNSFPTASHRKNSPPLVPPIPKPSVHTNHFLRSSSVYWHVYQEGHQHRPASTRRQRNTKDNLDPLARAASQLARRPGFAPRAPKIVSPVVPQPNTLNRRPGFATQSQGSPPEVTTGSPPVPDGNSFVTPASARGNQPSPDHTATRGTTSGESSALRPVNDSSVTPASTQGSALVVQTVTSGLLTVQSSARGLFSQLGAPTVIPPRSGPLHQHSPPSPNHPLQQ